MHWPKNKRNAYRLNNAGTLSMLFKPFLFQFTYSTWQEYPCAFHRKKKLLELYR
ncbi:MAG: hypothetical protein ACTS85_04845 [Arsenophonus sp. NC-PG7-MAG3]